MAASTSSSEDGGGTISDINVTPLVDVVLVLLIIMMVAAPMLVRSGLGLNLPKSSSGTSAPASEFKFSLKPKPAGQAGADLFFNEKPIDEAAAIAMMTAEVKKNPDVQVTVDGDKALYYDQIIHLFDWLRQVGVSKFVLSTDKK